MGSARHKHHRRLRQVLENRSPKTLSLIRCLIQPLRILREWYRKVVEQMRVETVVVSIESWPVGRPLVSVVIANFNYGKYLHEAIDSVLAQTFQDFEIIIIDDGSTDLYTREILAALNKPKTQVIFQENQGLPRTRNNGIKIAQGKYICCLDSDDCLKPTYLEKCIYELETRNLDVCFSWVRTFGASSSIWKNGPFLIDVLMKDNSVSVSAVFKKTLWELVGGYKEVMTDGYDDWEFWLTLAEQGAVGHCVPEPLMLHRKHSSSMSAGMKSRYDKIAEYIESLHPNLYKDPLQVKEIRKLQRRRFMVRNPLCNLLRDRNRNIELTPPGAMN